MQCSRLPQTYQDAKDAVSSALSKGQSVIFSNYRNEFTNPCVLKDHFIEPVEEGADNGYANMILTITYIERKFNAQGTTTNYERVKKLKLLSTIGDIKWNNRNIITKVWNGDYPTTVAVDVESGHVYLVYLYFNRFSLVYFGAMSDDQLEAFLYTVNDREPFSIFINPNTMFQYISETEGTNALQRGITITFNCGTPLVIFNQENL